MNLLTSLAILVLLKISVLIDQTPTDNIHYNIGFTHVDKHSVFEDNGLLLTDENSVTNTEILYQI